MTNSFVGSVELTSIVKGSLTLLEDKNKKVQKKGIKILSALAQTGEHSLRHPVCDR
jgi:hypothetical protein